MTRRLCMWIAVISLVGLGGASATASLARLYESGGGWTFYTPYSPPSQSWAMRVMAICNYVQLALIPVAGVSSAIYMPLLDRDVRRGAISRGFDVGPEPPDNYRLP